MEQPTVAKAQKVIPLPSLHLTDGPAAGRMIRLEHAVGTLGRRDDNAYVLADPRVSRVHAELRREGDTLIVTDLSSSGGTKLNGEPLSGPSVVHHGDKLEFGPVKATFEDPAAAGNLDEATMVFAAPVIETGPHLSPRQQEVLELMAEGLTNAQIGETLGITERTVKAYAQELYDKLGVRNRAGAVAQGAKLELL